MPNDPALPETMLAWPLYGVGLENLGENGRPVHWPVLRPGPGELLVRVDAVGLCYSDVKIIRLGSQHPRIYGRDLATNPVVQGHEVALTVVEVGEGLGHRFRAGHRLALQADVYHNGRNMPFGYVFRGGLQQYAILPREVLDGDEGCYAIPAQDGLSYAEIALTEPWACVEAAYVPRRRVSPRAGGTLWIVGRPGDGAAYTLGEAFAGGWPARIVVTDVPAALRQQIAGAEVIVHDGVRPKGYAGLAKSVAGEGFDDIIALDPDAAMVENLMPAAAAGSTINLAGRRPLGRPVSLDVGRLHYDYVTFVGTSGLDLGAAYGEQRNRTDVRPGDTVWVIGGGGPMGRMHLQRIIEMEGPPCCMLVAERNYTRAYEAEEFVPLAAKHGVDLRVVNPRQLEPEAYEHLLSDAHAGRGFGVVVVMVADVAAIENAVPHLAPDGLLVIFAGLARGTMASLDISNVYLDSMQITGSAGSSIRDQALVLNKVALGHLSTASSVSAVGGMDAARDGIQALMDGSYPGKVVIYPQVPAFPLTALRDLVQAAPAVFSRLSPEGNWTLEAEVEFLRRYGGVS